MYTIESRSDLNGNILVVRVPQSRIDTKAFRTILSDPPKFLVPFRCRYVDDMAELTYSLGSLIKIQYFGGQRRQKEYLEFWTELLNPVMICDDRFMKPFSFVLDTDNIYYDNTQNAVSPVRYIYIPTTDDCSDFAALKKVVETLSQQITSNDKQLETIVLRGILNFTPAEFMRALKDYKPSGAEKPDVPPPSPAPYVHEVKNAQAAPPQKPAHPAHGIDGFEIKIGGKDTKQQKPVKQSRPVKEKKPLFSGLLGKNKEIILGAAAEKTPVEPHPQVIVPNVDYGEMDCTEIVQETASEGARLRFDGDKSQGFPQTAALHDDIGRQFSIGRFDVNAGVRQNDLEFAKETKNVSRRHAVIEKKADGYVILDLNSKAGTFVNGQKIQPGVQFPLRPQTRISFGNAGADYIFEV